MVEVVAPVKVGHQTDARSVARVVEQSLAELVQDTPAAGNMVEADLISGTTLVNHGLGRQPIGWALADINGAATVYRSAWDSSKLSLVSSAAVSAKIWVW